MRRFLLVLVIVLVGFITKTEAQFPATWPMWACGPEVWVRCTEFWVPRDNPTNVSGRGRGSYLAFASVGVDGTDYAILPNTWTTLDLTRLGVPRDARAVFLHTLAIITHGSQAEVVGGTFQFRRPGTFDSAGWYHSQVCEAAVGGGQRTNDAIFAPCENGFIDVYWSPQRAVQANWPTGSSVGLSIAVNAWAR